MKAILFLAFQTASDRFVFRGVRFFVITGLFSWSFFRLYDFYKEMFILLKKKFIFIDDGVKV